MNDVSRLTGASPVSPSSNRVWKSPHKQKPGDRRAKRKREEHSGKEEDRRETRDEQQKQETPGIEEVELQDNGGKSLTYGPDGLRKPQNRKVDLII